MSHETMEEAKRIVARLDGMSDGDRRALLESCSEDVRVAVREIQKDAYFAPANVQLSTRRERWSPSGKYKLVTTGYATKPGCWSYTRGLVTLNDTGATIADVKRNYSSFPASWIEGHANGHDYLICGADYQGQTVIELDTGRRVDNLPKATAKGFGFCWASHHPNADGTLLAVNGCYWACPYETVIYDFADPMNPPWPELHRGDSDFGGWTGPASCKIGCEREILDPPPDACDEVKALAGKTTDPMTTEQLELIEAEETRLGKEMWAEKLTVTEEWTRPSALESTKAYVTGHLGWWKEQCDNPTKHHGGVAPGDVTDSIALMDKMIAALPTRLRVALMEDPIAGPLLAWKEDWVRGVT